MCASVSALLPITVLTAVLTALLHLVIDGVGVALAIVFWRRARPAAILTLIACAATS